MVDKNKKRTYETRTKVVLKQAPLLNWRARSRKPMTQEQAAKRAGVSLTTYQNAEYGRPLQLAKAALIARAAGIDLSELEQRKSA